MSVFSLLMFTMLLVMISNVASHVDDKMRMQNAADASAYSGGVVIARGMNTLALSNHLLTDVFAVTAFLREGEARNAEQMTPQIFEKWRENAERFTGSDFEKFAQLGTALDQQVTIEEELVTAFGDVTQRSAEYALPVFEHILHAGEEPGTPGGGLIPRFQRTVATTIPAIAQQATREVAYRHGLKQEELERLPNPPARSDRPEQAGALWRTSVETVGTSDESDPYVRTLPVIDPDPAGLDYGIVGEADLYLYEAIEERRQMSKYYLERWNRDKLRLFDREARLSQFSNIWRIITCAHLDRLLTEEYPESNLPFQLRRLDQRTIEQAIQRVELLTGLSRRRELDKRPLLAALHNEFDLRGYLDRDFHFVSVVYRKHARERGPGLFRNPLEETTDAITYAQVRLFLPQARRRLVYAGQGQPDEFRGLGGTFGFAPGIEIPRSPPPPQDRNPELERWPRENWPSHWDLMNQNWTCQLVPATTPRLTEILQTNPGGDLSTVRTPDLGTADIQIIKQVSPH